jgi:RNA polymerase sigma-70 factor (ECF subfamily)
VVEAASRGERWALTELFRSYHPGVLRYLRSQDRSAAEDLAGDVWIAVAERLPSFVGDEVGFRCWLFTIARNRLADHRRRTIRRRTSPWPADDMENGLGQVDTVQEPGERVVGTMSAQQAVERIVADLPPAQAEVLLLRVCAGLTVSEVAGIVGRSEGAVRVLQHRALRRLASVPLVAGVTE